MEIRIQNNTFKVDVGQNQKTWEHMNSGNWERETFEIIDYFTPKNGIAMDIGCWSGVISLYMAKTAKKIYAIDPDPICFKELQQNISLNPNFHTIIEPFQLAISTKKENLKLFAREQYGYSSTSILNRKRDTINHYEVAALSLNDFVVREKIQSVDFIKMDIEGAEFLILPNISGALKKLNHPTLYVSFHYNYLNEYLYSNYINSRWLTKVILKIERLLNLSFLKNKIKKSVHNLFADLNNYQYIYNHKGEFISYSDLIKNPSIIKNNELVFTNKKWEK